MEHLYEIVQKYHFLLDMAEDEEVNEEAFREALQSVSDDISDKAENYGLVITDMKVLAGKLDGEIKAIQEEVDRLKAKKQSVENKIEWLKKNLCEAMIDTDNPKIKTNHFSFWVQKSTPAVVIDDEAGVGLEYFDVPEPKISKSKIKEALSKGQKLEFAHLESHDIVRIK